MTDAQAAVPDLTRLRLVLRRHGQASPRTGGWSLPVTPHSN
jgi:hypothetical protein